MIPLTRGKRPLPCARQDHAHELQRRIDVVVRVRGFSLKLWKTAASAIGSQQGIDGQRPQLGRQSLAPIGRGHLLGHRLDQHARLRAEDRRAGGQQRVPRSRRQYAATAPPRPEWSGADLFVCGRSCGRVRGCARAARAALLYGGLQPTRRRRRRPGRKPALPRTAGRTPPVRRARRRQRSGTGWKALSVERVIASARLGAGDRVALYGPVQRGPMPYCAPLVCCGRARSARSAPGRPGRRSSGSQR